MEFSRQEYWSGPLFPSPEDLPNPGIKPWSSTLQADSLPPYTKAIHFEFHREECEYASIYEALQVIQMYPGLGTPAAQSYTCTQPPALVHISLAHPFPNHPMAFSLPFIH